MSAVIKIEIPREIMHVTRMTPQEMKQELAITLYERGKLSFGKACELAGMSVGAFQQLLGRRGIAILYDLPEYHEDLATLKKLGRL